MSPGAATDDVTLFFSAKKTDDLFSHRLWRVMTFLDVVSLPPRVTTFRVDTRLKLFLWLNLERKKTLNSATKINFSRVSPTWRVSPGAVRPLSPAALVTPLFR